MITQITYYEQKLAYEMDPADLFAALDQGSTEYVVVDTRQAYAYDEERIPGAIHFRHLDMNEETTAELDRSKTYVCYCAGIGCNGSTKGSLNLTRLGFKVKELIGGLEWWKKDGFATEGTGAAEGALISCAC